VNDPVKPFETVSGFGGDILATWLKPGANEILNANHNHYLFCPAFTFTFLLSTFALCLNVRRAESRSSGRTIPRAPSVPNDAS
jgi:hypothetical protein